MAAQEADNLRQAVFGANDGLVSTFGLVAGLVGAAASRNILIIANVVNMFAAGMSMGFGTYLATKSQVEFHERTVADEQRKIKTNRKAALKELRELFVKRGVPTKDLKRHMDTVTDSDEEWLSFVLEEKHGIVKSAYPKPVKGALIMFGVFVACGLIPIMPLFFATGFHALIASAIVTGIALFAVGAMKQQFVGKVWWRLGLENLAIGAITGTVGFIAGVYTGSLVSSYVH